MPNDSGQLWSGKMQWGKETIPGTAVAATRIMYLREPMLSVERDPRVHRFMTGTRDNVRAYTNGPIAAGGSLSLPVSAEECLELFAISVQGSVTPTTPSGATLARLFTFKPAGALDSATIEWADGARTWQGLGMKGNSLTVQGATNEENVVSLDLFGTNVLAGSLTGALSERTPSFLEGWQSRLFIDGFTATPGQTPIPGLLRNWNIQFNNALDRVYTSDNTLATNRVVAGELDITATLTFDAFAAQALTEFTNWSNTTARMVSIQFLGPADEIEAGANEAQTWTMTGTPTAGNVVVSVLGQPVTIVFNSTNAQAQTAINAALAVLGTGHTVTVTNGPFPGTPLIVTYDGAQVSGRNVPIATLTTNALTGGTTPTIGFVETTPGRSGRKEVWFDLPGNWTSVNLGGSANGIRTYEFSHQSVYQSTLAAMAQVRVQTNRTTIF